MSAVIPPETAPNEPPKQKPSRLRRLIEFNGIRRLSFGQYQSRVRNLYDGPAGAVLAIASAISLHEPLMGRMLRQRRFDVTRFKSILDLGSGAGQILRHLIKIAPDGTEIVACDLSHQMLRRARKRVKSQRPCYVAADMTRLPFADESFDCVTCGYVIEYLPDPRPGLEEIGRVLRPGGSLLLLATEDNFNGALTSRTWKCRTYNRQELQEACEESGLPWHGELWFTPVHRFFRMGGILVEAQKPINGSTEPAATPE